MDRPAGYGELKLFTGSAHPELAREIAHHLGLPIGQCRLRRFPDTEVSFQIDENIRGTDVFVVQPTCADVDRHLVEMCVMIDAFRRSSASRITAVSARCGDICRQHRSQCRRARPDRAGARRLRRQQVARRGTARHYAHAVVRPLAQISDRVA